MSGAHAHLPKESERPTLTPPALISSGAQMLERLSAVGHPVVPRRWRVMQRAAYRLIEQGKPVTQVNLAAEVGVTKQAVWTFFRSQPGRGLVGWRATSRTST
jgi:hypothetical protein